MRLADQLGVIVVDESGAILYADESAGRMCGWEPDLLRQRNVDRVLRVQPHDPDEDADRPYLTSSARKVTVTRRALGSERNETILLLAPVTGSESLDPVDELRRRLDEVAELSHKINNPLASVLGRVQLLRMKGSDPKVERAATIIEESARRIAGFVRELAIAARQHTDAPMHAGLARPRPSDED